MLGKISLFIEISLNKSYQTEKDKELHDKVIWQERAEKNIFPSKARVSIQAFYMKWNENKVRFKLFDWWQKDEDKTQLYTTNSNQWLTKNYF